MYIYHGMMNRGCEFVKKFLLGLLCGAAIFALTAASNNEIKALISTIDVQFHVSGGTNESLPADTMAINYQNRLYVPLRAFGEKMDASVYYTAPQHNGDRGRVNIYYEDDRDLPLHDKDGYVSAGQLDVKSTEDGYEYLFVSGKIRFNKQVPEGKAVALAVLDEAGKELALSGTLRLGASPGEMEASQFGAGDLTAFRISLPYMDVPEKYEFEFRIVDRPTWDREQYPIGAGYGAGGVNGYPLAARMMDVSNGPNAAKLSIEILNLSLDANFTTSKPLALEYEIYYLDGNDIKVVRTLKVTPFEGTIPWKHGAVQTTFAWDYKDGNGAAVPKGETYYGRIKLPAVAEGYMADAPKEIQSFTLETSMAIVAQIGKIER